MEGMKQFGIAVFLTFFVVSLFLMSYRQRTNIFMANDLQDTVNEKTTRKQERLTQWRNILHDRESAAKERRLPDVIGIGVKKCGTGALIHFLGQHPLIKLPKRVETFFFDKYYSRGLRRYKASMPIASKEDLVMEKTPSYFYFEKVIERIRRDLPNAKLILSLCDPVKRAFSDFVHRHFPGHKNEEASYFADTFHSLAHAFLSLFPSKQSDLTLIADEAMRKCSAKGQSCVFSNGMYHFEVHKWQDSFNDSQLLVLNGDEWLTDPGALVEEIQEFLQIPKLLIREDFVKSHENEFYCLNRWWIDALGDVITTRNNEEADEDGLFCLGSGKGRTRNGVRSMHPETYEKLKAFYKPHNELLYTMLNRNMGW